MRKLYHSRSRSIRSGLLDSAGLKKTNSLLSSNRMAIHRTIKIVMGHCTFGRHAEKFGIPSNDYCRSCRSQEENETIFHFMCRCPALALKRKRFLVFLFFASITDVSDIKVLAIVKFILEPGWFL